VISRLGVVAVSRAVPLRPPICDYCGCYTEDREQRCPARGEGRCQP
jgi:hypothetical protein